MNKEEKKRFINLIDEYLSKKCKIIEKEDILTAAEYYLDHPELWKKELVDR